MTLTLMFHLVFFVANSPGISWAVRRASLVERGAQNSAGEQLLDNRDPQLQGQRLTGASFPQQDAGGDQGVVVHAAEPAPQANRAGARNPQAQDSERLMPAAAPVVEAPSAQSSQRPEAAKKWGGRVVAVAAGPEALSAQRSQRPEAAQSTAAAEEPSAPMPDKDVRPPGVYVTGVLLQAAVLTVIFIVLILMASRGVTCACCRGAAKALEEEAEKEAAREVPVPFGIGPGVYFEFFHPETQEKMSAFAPANGSQYIVVS